jgi:hypothetical protein
MLNSVLHKVCTGAGPYYLDVWQPVHQGNVEELKKINGLELEDLRSVPFNVDVAYALGKGTPHGRYVNISIVLH